MRKIEIKIVDSDSITEMASTLDFDSMRETYEKTGFSTVNEISRLLNDEMNSRLNQNVEIPLPDEINMGFVREERASDIKNLIYKLLTKTHKQKDIEMFADKHFPGFQDDILYKALNKSSGFLWF